MEERTSEMVSEETGRERVAERRWKIAVFSFVAVGCAMPLGFVSAQSITQRLISTILVVLAKILEVIIYFIGKLVILIVDAVISVAQYNHFIDATPVKAGWPLVRDVTNMFVIVILLAIAFGTLIGYQKLHYKGVLGKLLVMAVLVNFSKQLIGLLIDFSQVVMLTFVNAFRAAAGGNFTQALKLDKMLALNVDAVAPGATTDASTPGDPLLIKTVIALMLAVFFLGISCVLLIIMLIYLIFRIVGLWIALILSPLALFLTAVPPVISGKVHSIAGGYWDKLSSLVSGGPVMAFFIWLTLATIQGGGFGTFGITAGAGANEATTAFQSSGFANAIGNIEDVSTFFVAVVMLLMGVDTAIGMSGSLGPMATGMMRKVQRTGIGAAKIAAYGAPALAGLAIAKGGGVGARLIENRADFAGRIGRGMQRAGLAIGAPMLAAQGAQLARRRTVQRQQRAKVLEQSMVGLSPADKLKEYERIAGRTIRDPAGARAAELAIAKTATTFEGGQELAKRFEAEGAAKGLKGNDLAAYRDEHRDQYVRSHLAELEDAAKAEGDEDTRKWVLDQREKNLALARPGDNIADNVAKLSERTNELDIPKTFTAASFANAHVADGVMQGTDILDEKGEWNKGSVWYKKLIEPQGMASKALEARRLAVIAAAGGGAAAYTLMKSADPQEQLKKLGASGGRIIRTGAGKYQYINSGAFETTAAEMAAGKEIRPRNTTEIRAGKELIAERQRTLAEARTQYGAQSVQAVAAESALSEVRLATLQNGANLGEVYQLNNSGVFEDDESRKAFARDIQSIQSSKGVQDEERYKAIDGLELTQNANAYSDTRATFVQHVDVGKLGSAARMAQQQVAVNGRMADKSALQNIGNLARAIDIQGAQAEHLIDNSLSKRNLDQSTIKAKRTVLVDQVRDAAKAYEDAHGDADAQKKAQDALKKVLDAEHVDPKTFTMEQAQAMLKRQQLKDNSALQNYSKYASSQTAEALKKVGVGAAAAAGVVTTKVARGARIIGESATPSGRNAGRMRRGMEAFDQGDRSGPAIEPPRPGQGVPRRAPDWQPSNRAPDARPVVGNNGRGTGRTPTAAPPTAAPETGDVQTDDNV